MIAKRKTLCAGMLLALLWVTGKPALAQAEYIGPYLQVQAGGYLPDAADMDDLQGRFNLEFDPDLQLGAAVGYALDPDWGIGTGRLELAYSYQTVTADSAKFADGKVPATGDLQMQTLMLNAWGHARLESGISAYVGAGIGAGLVKADQLQISGVPFSDDDATGLAYQFGCGADFAVTERFWLDLGYRFQGMTEIELAEADGTPLKTTLHGHSLILGLRVGF